MIEYIEEQLRRGYEFYLNVDNLTRFQGFLKKGENIIPIHSELLKYLLDYEGVYNSLLDNSNFLKLAFDFDKFILERYTIISKGIYGALSKYGKDLYLESNSVNNLLTEYEMKEKGKVL